MPGCSEGGRTALATTSAAFWILSSRVPPPNGHRMSNLDAAQKPYWHETCCLKTICATNGKQMKSWHWHPNTIVKACYLQSLYYHINIIKCTIVTIQLLDGSVSAYQMTFLGCSRTPACQISAMIRSPFLQGGRVACGGIGNQDWMILEMPKNKLP